MPPFLAAVLLALLASPPSATAAPKNSAEKTRSLATDWLPASGHPFRKYAKVTLILSYGAAGIEPQTQEVQEELARRDPAGLVQKLIAARELGRSKDTALILDCPGQLSAALAVELARQAGFQPIPLLNGVPRKGGQAGTDKTMAALAALRSQASQRGGNAQDAPPAFFLDRSRLEPGAATQGALLLPTAEALEAARISRVLYIYEQAGPADKDSVARDLSGRLAEIRKRLPVETLPLRSLAEPR